MRVQAMRVARREKRAVRARPRWWKVTLLKRGTSCFTVVSFSMSMS